MQTGKFGGWVAGCGELLEKPAESSFEVKISRVGGSLVRRLHSLSILRVVNVAEMLLNQLPT
jgi:hypothetical protein